MNGCQKSTDETITPIYSYIYSQDGATSLFCMLHTAPSKSMLIFSPQESEQMQHSWLLKEIIK